MTNYLRDYGPRLIDNGYNIVPIKRGTKAPKGIAGWTEIKADLNQLGKWASKGFVGVGVLCKNNPAVDIDVLDREVSSQMESIVRKMFPQYTLLSRVGKAPKTLLAFRTDSPFKKIRSATYEDMFGDRHAVEILGDGQQYVAYAEHCETLSPYTWSDGEGIADVASIDLPLLTHAKALEIVKRFEEIAESTDGWTKVQDGTTGSMVADTLADESSLLADFSNLRPRLNITDEEIKRDLACLSPDEYERWIHVGMALYHQYNGTEEGFCIWHEWSQRSENYTDERSCQVRWPGFAPRGNGRQITFASVRRWARDGRMEQDAEGEFLERYVYVAEGDYVHDLSDLPHGKPFAMKAFRNYTAKIIKTIEVPAPTMSQPDRVIEKVVPVHKRWLVNLERKEARAFIYKPGKPKILKDANGESFINTFHMPEFANPCPTGEDGKPDEKCQGELLDTFFRHMEYIIPVEEEREWFYSWMAVNIQRPGKKSKVTPLLIATDHGTGRGWISQLMSLLLGSWNCTKTKMSVLNGESSAGVYQDFMNDSLLCCIEEVHDSNKPYGVEAKIRDYLTENTLEINVKYGAKLTKEVYTNFMFQSNHTDAMVLKAEDRRINVFRTIDGPKDGDYYEQLYGWLEPEGQSSKGTNTPKVGSDSEKDAVSDEGFYDRAGAKVSAGVACLYHWLVNRDLTDFNWKTSMDNKSRRELIENNQTDIEYHFLEMVKNQPYPVMTRVEIEEYLAEQIVDSGDPFGELSNNEKKQIKKLREKHLGKQERIKISREPNPNGNGYVT